MEALFQHPAFLEAYEKGAELQHMLGVVPDPNTFNPVIVDFYEQVGFIPDAMLNYLLLLGWSFDDKREEFTREEMIQYFSLDRVIKAPASFDPKKLMSFQERAMQRMPIKQKVALCLPFLQRAGLVSNPPPCEIGPYLTRIITAAGDRLKIAGDILRYRNFFVDDDQMQYESKVFQKWIVKSEDGQSVLRRYLDELPLIEPFEVATIEAHMPIFIGPDSSRILPTVHPIRIAVTGEGVGFGLYDAIAILGREHSMRRIRNALKTAESLNEDKAVEEDS
jgi:glutamyl-tRNA synthetase